MIALPHATEVLLPRTAGAGFRSERTYRWEGVYGVSAPMPEKEVAGHRYAVRAMRDGVPLVAIADADHCGVPTRLWSRYHKLWLLRPAAADGEPMYLRASFAAIQGYMVAAAGERSVERAVRRLAGHPAVEAFRYWYGRINMEHLAILVARIVDVRWFQSPERVDSSSRLAGWLGVHANNVRAMYGHGIGDSRLDRLRLFRSVEAGFDAYACRWAGASRDDVEAIVPVELRRLRRMVRCLYLVWLGAVSGHPEMRFDKERFFGKSPV